MKIINNMSISLISSILQSGGGKIGTFYEPETIDELVDVIKRLRAANKQFDIIGHCTNTYYLPGTNVENIISTRRLTNWHESNAIIEADCGTSIKKLAKKMVENGITSYEGLVDLPGTVASAVYGNASCYGSSISNLLVNASILTPDNEIIKVGSDWFDFKHRSSALKRKEKKGIILKIQLRRHHGNAEAILAKAKANHDRRKATQPSPEFCLGSIFANSGQPTVLNYILRALSKFYGAILKLRGESPENQERKRRHFTFVLLRATDVEPYMPTWNWYRWSAPDAHRLFWKYVRLHRMMYTRSEFEIEIKGKKIPI